jgi:hypothetical protein
MTRNSFAGTTARPASADDKPAHHVLPHGDLAFVTRGVRQYGQGRRQRLPDVAGHIGLNRDSSISGDLGDDLVSTSAILVAMLMADRR